MGLMKDVAKVISATAATIGTDSSGAPVAIAACSGFTFVDCDTTVATAELWPGATGGGFLCQTNDGATCTLTIDPTSGTGAPFSNGTGTPNKYHRVSLWVRAFRTDKDIAAFSNAQLIGFAVTPAGTTYSGSVNVTGIIDTQAPLAKYSPETASILLAVQSNNANVTPGADGVYNHTECGYCHNSTGVVSTTGSLAAGSLVNNTGTLPYDEWVRLDIAMDAATGAFQMGINGYILGTFDYGTALNTGAVGTWPRNWALLFPAITGLRWHVGGMTSWDDVLPTDDTGLAPLTKSAAWKQWGLAPPFTGARTPLERMVKSTANCTVSCLPYSINSGTRIRRERLVANSTSTSGVLFLLAAQSLPVLRGPTGYHHISTALRFQHDTWTGSLCFNDAATADFTITGAANVMTLKDSSGATMFSWACGDLAEITLTIPPGGGGPGGVAYIHMQNASKNFATDQTCFSSPCRLSSVTDITTETNILFSFSTTTTNSNMAIEAIEGYSIVGGLGIDSYVESPLSGTSGYVVDNTSTATFNVAARRGFECTAGQEVYLTSCDGYAAGSLRCPTNPTTPQWAWRYCYGRSGQKITAFTSTSLPGLAYCYGYHFLLMGGWINNTADVSDSATALSAAENVVNSALAIARRIVDNGGWFTWIRTPYPGTQPNNSYPTANTKYTRAFYFNVMRLLTAGLATMKATSSRGSAITIADSGNPDFIDGINLGVNGTVPAFVAASPTIGASIGTSQTGTSPTPIPSPSSGGSRRNSVIIQT